MRCIEMFSKWEWVTLCSLGPIGVVLIVCGILYWSSDPLIVSRYTGYIFDIDVKQFDYAQYVPYVRAAYEGYNMTNGDTLSQYCYVVLKSYATESDAMSAVSGYNVGDKVVWLKKQSGECSDTYPSEEEMLKRILGFVCFVCGFIVLFCMGLIMFCFAAHIAAHNAAVQRRVHAQQRERRRMQLVQQYEEILTQREQDRLNCQLEAEEIAERQTELVETSSVHSDTTNIV